MGMMAFHPGVPAFSNNFHRPAYGKMIKRINARRSTIMFTFNFYANGLIINIFPVTDSNNVNDKQGVKYIINNAIIPDPYTAPIPAF
jgi:hypothetical protein